MVDALFEDPRLATVYDVVDGARDDLDHYVAIADELGARTVVDIGCGTGSLACLLAERGLDVVGVDPAAAMLDVASGKPHADQVRWVHGDATALADVAADLAVMTGNVAQVFLADDDWLATLRAVRRILRPNGTFVFETRDPRREAWKEWNATDSCLTITLPGGLQLTVRHELVEVDLPLVTFRSCIRFDATNELLISESTLRFRAEDELRTTLHEAGFDISEIRDAPDRPGRELVVLAVPC